MSNDREEEKHPSYGILNIFRSSGSPQSLFGSSIEHSQTITFSISEGSRVRDLNRYWYHTEEPLVEIEMSPTQFIDAITHMNGEGVPVTIRKVGRERRIHKPHSSIKKLIQKEFDKDLKEIMDKSTQALEKLNDSLKTPSPRKADIREAISRLTSVIQDIKSNLPFVNTSFHKQMDKTITEAKGEIEAAFSDRIYALGSKVLIQQLEEGLIKSPPLIEEHELVTIDCDRCGKTIDENNIWTSSDGLETICEECHNKEGKS